MLKTIRGLVLAVGMLAAGVTLAAAHAPEVEAVAWAWDQGTLSFTNTQSSEAAQETSASGAAGAIRFQGSLQTPNPCYDVTAAQRQRGKRVIVTVTATPTDGFCTQVITYNNYSGQVSGLAAGTYDFQLVQVVGGRSTTVLTQQVTVS